MGAWGFLSPHRSLNHTCPGLRPLDSPTEATEPGPGWETLSRQAGQLITGGQQLPRGSHSVTGLIWGPGTPPELLTAKSRDPPPHGREMSNAEVEGP